MLPRSLLALVAAEVTSSLGTLMSVVALPWFVLQTTGSAGRMSVVLAAQAAPIALLAIPSSRVAHRLGARRTLLLCDGVWIPVVAAIPLLHWAGLLPFSLLVVLAFATGIPWAAHFGAGSAIVPEALGDDGGDVARANAVIQTAVRLTYFAGPAVGGVLLAALGAPTVMLVDAATFAVSFALVALYVRGDGIAAPSGEPAELARGAALLRRDAVLRPLTFAFVLSQGAFMAMNAAIPVLAFTAYGRDETLAGLLPAAWGGGAVVGGVIAFRVVDRRDPLRLGAAAWALQAAALWALAAGPSPAVALAALFLSGLGNGVRVPPLFGVVTLRVPRALRAGTMTLSGAIVLSGGFAALVLAGPLLDASGPGLVFAAVAAAQTLAAATVARLALRPRPVAIAP